MVLIKKDNIEREVAKTFLPSFLAEGYIVLEAKEEVKKTEYKKEEPTEKESIKEEPSEEIIEEEITFDIEPKKKKSKK